MSVPGIAGSIDTRSGSQGASTNEQLIAHLLMHACGQAADLHRAQIAVAVLAHGDRPGLDLLVAHDEHVGRLRKLGVPDLAAEGLARIVAPPPEAARPKFARDLARALVVAVGQG